MRYWVYDECGVLMRKFWDKESALHYMQEGWKLEVQPKPKVVKPDVGTYGEARW